MFTTQYNYSQSLSIILIFALLSLPCISLYGYYYDENFMAIVDDSSSLVITYIGIIGYLLIIITVLPIFYKRLINPLAIEIFPGEKIIYYGTYDEQIIYFSDIVHIELIKNPGKADTKSIHIETEKERESQILWKFLGITILNGNQNIKINLGGLLEDSDDIYKKILLEYKEALKSSMKELG